jgi:protein-S-isoprenylcysteine O-methyltransferase Ste14
MDDLQKQINEIKTRNARVEADKARETSRARKIIIAVLTYIVIVIFFYAAKLPNPLINAIVPTVGFILSTLGLNAIKLIRLKHRRNK